MNRRGIGSVERKPSSCLISQYPVLPPLFLDKTISEKSFGYLLFLPLLSQTHTIPGGHKHAENHQDLRGPASSAPVPLTRVTSRVNTPLMEKLSRHSPQR